MGKSWESAIPVGKRLGDNLVEKGARVVDKVWISEGVIHIRSEGVSFPQDIHRVFHRDIHRVFHRLP